MHGTPVVTKDAAVEGAANRLTQLMARQESGSNASDLHGAPPPLASGCFHSRSAEMISFHSSDLNPALPLP